MPVVKDDVRRLATVENVVEVLPIEDADKIEVSVVRGWHVVTKKGEFKPNDQKVIYFEVDSALPLSDERFAFLGERKTKHDDIVGDVHVLQTVRLRGVYSQGLVLPIDDFMEQIRDWAKTHGVEGADDPQWTPPLEMDVTDALGIGKWEIPLPASGGQQKGNFPLQYARKTDSERAQNLQRHWDEVREHQWEASEKIDGTSCTVVRDENGNLRVMGRNWEMEDGDNTYWNVVRRYHSMFDTLQPREGIQFEIAGPGLHGNHLGLNDIRPFVFDMVRNAVMVPRAEWPAEVLKWASPLRPEFKVTETPEELIEQVNGMKSAVTPGRLAEGVVFHTVGGETVRGVGDRNTFKVVSSKYLLKNE